jgi:hypothetical protein
VPLIVLNVRMDISAKGEGALHAQKHIQVV